MCSVPTTSRTWHGTPVGSGTFRKMQLGISCFPFFFKLGISESGTHSKSCLTHPNPQKPVFPVIRTCAQNLFLQHGSQCARGWCPPSPSAGSLARSSPGSVQLSRLHLSASCLEAPGPRPAPLLGEVVPGGLGQKWKALLHQDGCLRNQTFLS